ncbi:hypothetical protein N0V92_006588 [Colletotrichum tropicale]|nr:hypothetical protein N0V92_006588 [Colletotrichum tropicale]
MSLLHLVQPAADDECLEGVVGQGREFEEKVPHGRKLAEVSSKFCSEEQERLKFVDNLYFGLVVVWDDVTAKI